MSLGVSAPPVFLKSSPSSSELLEDFGELRWYEIGDFGEAGFTGEFSTDSGECLPDLGELPSDLGDSGELCSDLNDFGDAGDLGELRFDRGDAGPDACDLGDAGPDRGDLSELPGDFTPECSDGDLGGD